MSRISRREFLKALGLAGSTLTVGCSGDKARELIPHIIPAEDIVPGEATWYATTCRECPAGCGMLAKNRDGRVIKVEGNPAHPVNRGALCARGQASLQGLYNPDRYRGPMRREGDGMVPVSWSAGLEVLASRLEELRGAGKGEGVVFMSGLQNGTLAGLIGDWLRAAGGGEHIVYEPFAYEPLRAASKMVFGREGLPAYRIDEADFLISFGAGFLEAWLSDVEYARRFAAFRTPSAGGKNFFAFVGSRRSMTASNADAQLIVRPGEEWLVAAALLREILRRARSPELSIPPRLERALERALPSGGFAARMEKSGHDPRALRRIAERFMRAERPLALAAGTAHSGPYADLTAIASNLLCLVKEGSRTLIDFEAASSLEAAAPASRLKSLTESMERGEVELLVVHDANPVFSLPLSWNFREHLEKVGMVVSLSSAPDETSILADLVLPAHTPLESWGDYSPRKGVRGLLQPVMGPVFDTRHPGDLLLETGRKLSDGPEFQWPDFHALLKETWRREGPGPFSDPWHRALRQGGSREEGSGTSPGASLAADFNFLFPPPEASPDYGDAYPLTVYPTVQFFDGRAANRQWLQELPDPVTQVTWGGWAEIHPETAARLGFRKGDVARLRTPSGIVEVPVLPIPTVAPGTVALPIGQGHTGSGRFADGLPANPLALFPSGIDTPAGGIAAPAAVTVERTGKRHPVANTDGSFSQEGRDLAESLSFGEYRRAVAVKRKPHVDPPLAEGFDPRKDFNPPHAHKDYRWCMVVDLDRCTGCSSCVVACYAENNVACVGRKEVLKGREMSWLRIQRYFSGDGSVRWLPMLCQHCDAAPCEAVCPVFAPHHGEDGLNNQIYNRCFGTRFCSQNDPYKVRRYNWFTFTRAAPLDWQLNPDVTVRQQGVMEKCSFCVQRIVEAKFAARREKRLVRDGEFTTACAQTCPTEAIIFGNLKDPESRVARLIRDPRAYQALHHLNTRPAVIYLKKLTQEL